MAAKVQVIRSREQKEISSWDDKNHPKKKREKRDEERDKEREQKVEH
jgi:hypothetical protein